MRCYTEDLVLVRNIINKLTSQNKLIIRLGSDAVDPIYWYMEMQDSGEATHGKLASYCELVKIPGYTHCRVQVLVSSSRVIFRKVDIKNKKIRKSIKAIGFIIEQSIVGNIDDYHIILLECDNDFCYVAAVEHELMKIWLGWLQSAKISTEILMPDVLALPYRAGEWHTANLGNEWLMRSHEMSGFSVQETILEKLYISRFIPVSEEILSPVNDKPTTRHFIPYCDVLRIMSENIGNCNANFLLGKYSYYKSLTKEGHYSFKVLWSLLLLSILICFGYLIDNYKVEEGIAALTSVSESFHRDFSWDNKKVINDTIDFSDYIYRYNRRMLNLDFISQLHNSSHIINDLDVGVNRIYIDNDRQRISFNVSTIRDSAINEKLIKVDEKLLHLNSVVVNNSDGTHNVIFKCCQ
ncbi:general secretion pathway protein L [Yersinia aleksiciae]|nr:general secretion pathway protein L [Yersinia aleksiciae]